VPGRRGHRCWSAGDRGAGCLLGGAAGPSRQETGTDVAGARALAAAGRGTGPEGHGGGAADADECGDDRPDVGTRAGQTPGEDLADWDDAVPGFVEIDLVGHEAGVATGQYCFNLTMTHIATGWTVNRSVPNKAQQWVFAALQYALGRFTFPIVGRSTQTTGPSSSATTCWSTAMPGRSPSPGLGRETEAHPRVVPAGTRPGRPRRQSTQGRQGRVAARPGLFSFGVSVAPGDRTLTVIPRGASSCAHVRPNPIRAALMAAYWLLPGDPLEVRLPSSTILPPSGMEGTINGP
jgi:hypothetical protein